MKEIIGSTEDVLVMLDHLLKEERPLNGTNFILTDEGIFRFSPICRMRIWCATLAKGGSGQEARCWNWDAALGGMPFSLQRKAVMLMRLTRRKKPCVGLKNGRGKGE